MIEEVIHRVQMVKAHLALLRTEPGISDARQHHLTLLWTVFDALHRYLLRVKNSKNILLIQFEYIYQIRLTDQ